MSGSKRLLPMCMAALLAFPGAVAAAGDARVSGDQLLFFYDARSGRVPFFSVANPSPDESVDVEIAIYPEALDARLGAETLRLPPLGNVVVDLTQAAGGAAAGRAGLAVVTPVVGLSDARPIVPPEPLVGTFTLANVPLESGFGENPIGRRAVSGSGAPAASGRFVDGDAVSYERLTPAFLMVPVFFNPQQLGPPEDDGNRVVVAAFADSYGARFDLLPRRHEATVSILGADGELVAGGMLAVNGLTRTDLQALAGDTMLTGSGKVLLEVDAADGSVVGLFSQSLGPFGAGQRMPSVFDEPVGGRTVDDALPSGDQLLFFYDARDGRVPFFSIANPSSDASVVAEISVYDRRLAERVDGEIVTLAPLGNLVVDLTELGTGAAGGRVGLAVVTPIVGESDTRPVVPPEPLVGTFTLANVPLESGFGENPIGRLAVRSGGSRASAGDVVTGTGVAYQRLAPDVLMVPVFFNPQQLAPPDQDGNRIVLVGFDDRYGDRFELEAHAPRIDATLFDATGALLGSSSVDVDGVTLTNLQALVPASNLTSSGKVFFDVDAGQGNVFGLFSQSLGPFGAGQRMPAVDVDTSRFPMVTPEPQPTATPQPEPTTTAPGPTPPATPQPTAAPSPTPTAPLPPPGPTATPAPTTAPSTPGPTNSPGPVPTPGPTASPAPTAAPTPSPAPTAAPTPPGPTATPPPGPTATPTPSPAPTATPTPAPTPTPTPTPDPTPTPTAAPLSYAQDAGPILVGACGGCHISGSSGGFNFGGGVGDLVDVPSNQSQLPYVTAGSPAGSYLLHKIDGTQLSVGGSGGQMPLGGSLPGPDIAIIEQWILDGALP